MKKINNTYLHLQDWHAVLSFLSGISAKENSVTKVSIEQNGGNDWRIAIENKHENTSSNDKARTAVRMVGLHDLGW